MLLFLISCVTFILLSRGVELICFWKQILCSGVFVIIPAAMSMSMSIKKKSFMVRSSKTDNVEDYEMDGLSCLLDLPELALECILEKLPPSQLCKLAQVCTSLRERCRSDHLWERHLKQKWDRVMGESACRHWKWHSASVANIKDSSVLDRSKKRSLAKSLSCVCSTSWVLRSKSNGRIKSSLPADSMMSWYMSLETGKFWFPAQVYNREQGHVGFILSCYDAELSYDSFTDTFQARYPPHGPRTAVVEEGVQWNRLRAPPVDTAPHYLHVSDCLNDLHPGDHIEIQWRRNREFPYGWWYGVVGHLESCNRDGITLCRCHTNETVVLEFNQYTLGSRWRQTIINRKDHREEGNETDGFYGGIRKLHTKEEITMWKSLWPKDTLQ